MKVQWIPLRDLESATRETVSRFLVLTFLLVVGAANHLYMDISENRAFEYYSRNLFMAILVLLPLLYCIRMLHESNWIRRVQRHVLEGLTVVVAGVYFWSLPDSDLLPYHFSQFWLYLTIAVLFAFVCIKDCITDDDLFWHFHISLLSRLSITALYTSVILGGTSAALGAIDALFKTKLMEHQEIRIVILTLWLFTPLFFLTGVPRLTGTEKLRAYKPQWIRNIAIYVLIPFTTVYLGILYAYMGKITVQWKLPDGMVSYLVLSFAAFGILSLVIVFPFQRDESSRWTEWFGRLFYFLQFPLLILLAVAIYRRVADYGITFRRFYVLVLAVWLLFITVFMVLRKNRNLIAIPSTLLLLALLSSFGPWSAFNVSFVSQKARLDRILAEHGLIASGRLTKPDSDIPGKVKGEICSITKYLFDYGKLDVYRGVSAQKDTLTPKAFTEQLGFEYKEQWGHGYDESRWFSYSFMDSTFGISDSSFDFLVRMRTTSWCDTVDKRIDLNGITVEYLHAAKLFRFTTPRNDSMVITLEEVLAEFERTADTDRVGELVRETDRLKVVCLFEKLSGTKKPEGVEISGTMTVDLLIQAKE
jgi:hypothetical protein